MGDVARWRLDARGTLAYTGPLDGEPVSLIFVVVLVTIFTPAPHQVNHPTLEASAECATAYPNCHLRSQS